MTNANSEPQPAAEPQQPEPQQPANPVAKQKPEPEQPAEQLQPEPAAEQLPEPAAEPAQLPVAAPGPAAAPRRLRIPTKSQIRAQAVEIEREAQALVWRFIATEAAELPTDDDITIDDLGEALSDLGWNWEQLNEWIVRLKEARLAIKPFDRGAAKTALTKAQTGINKAQTKAAELRQQADRVEREANDRYGAALHNMSEAQKAEGNAAMVYQEAMLAGCPGTLDLQLRTERRIVRVLRPSIEMGKPVDPGDIIEYAGPNRPWLEDYDGEVAPGGNDPVPTLTVNEGNEAIAAKIEADAAQFEAGGLPGKQLLKTNTIEITSRPTRVDDFPDPNPTIAGPVDDVRAPQPGDEDDDHNPLPTHAKITSKPTHGQIPDAPEAPFDPWADDE